MMEYVAAIGALCDTLSPPTRHKPQTSEQRCTDAIREARIGLATFMLQGALFAPTTDLSVQCFKHYMQAQHDIMMDDFRAALGAYSQEPQSL